MPINNAGRLGSHSPIEDLLRLQTDFQQRLTEETLRYLRQLQSLTGPVTPGTFLLPDTNAGIQAQTSPGATATFSVDLENRQRVHCLVSPMLSLLASDTGVTWFPAATFDPSSALLASGNTVTVKCQIAVPQHIPAGIYRGGLVLYGFQGGMLPIRIEISESPDNRADGV